jgi:uncharacterized protein YbjT (DUF2867 family)
MTGTISKTILVTGATGNLGRAVVQALGERGFQVKAGSTKPERASRLPGVAPVKVVYEEPDTVIAALEGVDGLLLVAPPLDPEAPDKLRPVIDQARSRGIGHVIFISVLGADQDEAMPLRVIEGYLLAAGVNYTILRPNFFMENFSSGFVGPMISQGGIFLAAGDGKTSFISTADIATVAALAFQQERYGMTYNLTGPSALDHAEVAKIISEVSGKAITYQALSEDAMLQGARANGMPESAVQYLAALYRPVRQGLMSTVTEDVQQVTGKAPISFAEFARGSASFWK